MDENRHITSDDSAASHALPVDDRLYELLRGLRNQIASKAGVPLYMVFSNASLETMASYYPKTKADFGKMKGIGAYKVRAFSDQFLKLIVDYCQEHAIDSKAHLLVAHEKASSPEKQLQSVETTIRLYQQGIPINEIALLRDLSQKTVMAHLQQAYSAGAELSVDTFVPLEKQQRIIDIFRKLGTSQLTAVMEYLTNGSTYDELRWVRAKLIRENPSLATA